MGRRGDVRRSHRLDAASARAGQQRARHGARPSPRRVLGRGRGLGRVHGAVRRADGAVRLWRGAFRQSRRRALAQGADDRRGGGGGAGAVGHGAELGTRPRAHDARRGVGRHRAHLSRHDGPAWRDPARRHRRILPEARGTAGGAGIARARPACGRVGRARALRRAARRIAARGRCDRRLAAQGGGEFLPLRLIGVRRRTRAAAAPASIGRAAGMGRQRHVPRRIWRGAGGARAALHLRRVPRHGDRRRELCGDRPRRRVPAGLPARRRHAAADACVPRQRALWRGLARRQRGRGRARAGRALHAGVDERHHGPARLRHRARGIPAAAVLAHPALARRAAGRAASEALSRVS